jgi:leucyl/phenylalanyl-tRNA---protein transferase
MPVANRSRTSSRRPSTDRDGTWSRGLEVLAAVIDPALVVRAYREGIFPMAVEDGQIGWFSPDPRGILPLETFHVPTRLSRVVKHSTFSIATDRDFEGVMRACAKRPGEGTWISDQILQTYVALHQQGIAHSVEAWREGRLVGGLYGIHLGGAFFGESMFHRETDASKVALVALVERLTRRGFTLLDTQWVTPHLRQFGGIEISRRDYLSRLTHALGKPCEW